MRLTWLLIVAAIVLSVFSIIAMSASNSLNGNLFGVNAIIWLVASLLAYFAYVFFANEHVVSYIGGRRGTTAANRPARGVQ